MTLLALLLLGDCSRAGGHCRDVRAGGRGGSSLPIVPPLFAFATGSGAGMSAACACSDVTGTLGEVVTFTRASDGWCSKGNPSTGIVNGDLVKCSTDQPRVMSGGVGSLGLLMEPARTNDTLRSEELDSALVWTSLQSGVAAPTITADYGTAPNNAATGDRIQFAATTTGQYVGMTQVTSCLAGAVSVSMYVKGVSGSGIMDIYPTYQNCAYNSTTWTRCKQENTNASAAILFGNLSALSGVANAANDVLVWGVQCEAAAYASSYIATAGSTVTRATETAAMDIGSISWTKFSLSASWILPSYMGAYQPFQIYFGADDMLHAFGGSAAGTTPAIMTGRFRIGGSNSDTSTSALMAASSTVSAAIYYDGTNRAACVDGTCTTTAGALTLPTGAASLYIGSRQDAAGRANGIIKNVCADPSATKCR